MFTHVRLQDLDQRVAGQKCICGVWLRAAQSRCIGLSERIRKRVETVQRGTANASEAPRCSLSKRGSELRWGGYSHAQIRYIILSGLFSERLKVTILVVTYNSCSSALEFSLSLLLRLYG